MDADPAELVRDHVLRQRVRIEPFFETFDMMRHREVTMEQAVRALASAGMEVPPGLGVALRRCAAPSGRFLYVDFMDDVHSLLGEAKGLERDPGFDTSVRPPRASFVPSGAATMRGKAPSLSRAEQAAADAALDRIAGLVRARSVHLPGFVRQFDRSGRGIVTVGQLDRALATALPGSAAADRAALARAFTWDAGSRSARVSARDLAAAVHEAAGDREGHDDAPGPASGAARPWPGRASSSSAESKDDGFGAELVDGLSPAAAAALADVRKHAVERRIRVRDAFVDFDPLHRGAVTKSQFVRALAALPLGPMRPRALEALADAFVDDRRPASSEPSVDYAAFSDRVELAFGAAPGAERDPTAEPPMYGAAAGLTIPAGALAGSVRAESTRASPSLSPAQAEALERALRSIRSRIHQRRVELVGVFKDFDRTNEEHVTEAQFLRALRSLGLWPGDAGEADALVAAFRGQGANRSRQVNWRAFRNAVDDAAEEDAARQRQAEAGDRAAAEAATRSAALAATATRPSDARVLLARIKAWAVRDNVRAGEFLRDADPLRRGALPSSKVAAALSAAGFPVRAGDEPAILAAYPAPGAGFDHAGRPLVDWRALEADIEAAFGPRSLETRPDADVEALRASALLGTASLAGREAELGLRPSAEDPASTLRRFTLGAGSAPTPATMLAASAAAAGATGERLTPAERREVVAALARAGHWAVTSRLELPPVFLGFDRHHSGCLPEPQLRRCVSTVRLPLAGRELDLVCLAFASRGSDGRSDVSWAWLAAALEQPEAVVAALPPPGAQLTRAGAVEAKGTAVAVPGSAGAAAGPLLTMRLAGETRAGAAAGRSGEGLGPALEELRRRCAARRVSLKEHFVPHDALNHGVVSAVKLRAALATAGLSDLPPFAVAALQEAFKNDADPSMVDWRELVERVEGGGRDAAALEKDPLATLRSHAPARRMADGDVADPDAAGAAATAVAEVSRTMRQRRIDLKARLVDFDRQRRGTVPACRFKSVLAAEIRTLSPAALDALAAAFASRDSPGSVAWRAFLAAAEPGA